MKMIIVCLLLSVSSISYAEWTVSHSDFIKKWMVSDGKVTVQYKTKKAAKKAAKALNKAKASGSPGFWDDGSDACKQPGVRC